MNIAVGKVLKAQGIKGEIKIGCYSKDSVMLKKLKELTLEDKDYAVKSIRCDGQFCYALLEGVNDRNTAELLRDIEVYANKDSLNLQEDTYFVEDIIGCRLALDDGTTIGKVVDILQYGSADVYVCEGNGKNFSFPFLKDLVVSVNLSVKSITVSKKRFDEVVCYED